MVQKWDLTFTQQFLGDSVENMIKVPFKWGCMSNGQGASRMGPEEVCPKVDLLDNKTLRSVHFGVVVVELINCKCGGIVRNQIW